MGEDLESRGSMVRNRSNKGIHPVSESGVPVYMPAAPPAKRRISFLIPLIVVACIVMFVVTMYVNNCPANTVNDKCVAKFLRRFSFQPFNENRLLGPSSRTLQKLGALDTSKVSHGNQGWRLVSCMWLHAGVIHIAANMLSLLVIGIKLEQEFGLFKIGAIYLLSGFGGSLLSSLFLQNRISVGASGAVFGLLGAMLSELITNWSMYETKCAALITLIVVVVLNLAVGILPLVDNFAHIGGFIVGFLAGFVLLMLPRRDNIGYTSMPPGYTGKSRRKLKYKGYQCVLMITSLIILIAGITVVLVLVLRGVDGNKKCSWCHYLSCVPTSKWDCNSSGTASCSTFQQDNSNTMQITCLSNNATTTVSADLSSSMMQSACVQLCS